MSLGQGVGCSAETVFHPAALMQEAFAECAFCVLPPDIC